LVSSAAVHDVSIGGALLQGNFKLEAAKSGLFSAQTIESVVAGYLNTVKNADNLEQLFGEFKQLYGKAYESVVYETSSKAIFRERLLMVLENNLKALHGQSSYIQQLQAGSDLPLDQLLLQPAGNWPTKSSGQFYDRVVANVSTSAESSEYVASWIVDYTAQRQVASVVNQGGCGACVYFAASALIESFWARKGHGLDHLSPQQLNDCARDENRGNHGCEHGGGTFVPTFDYIRAHGLTTEKNYPYTAKDGNCDRTKEANAVARISNWHPILPHDDEMALEAAIHDHGPVAVAIHVSDQLSHYKSGIFDGECQGGRNHAVLAVGYGWDDATKRDYWVLKNQWGDGWGEHGFFKLQRKHGNMCDVAGDAVYVE
jgi:C1A family cysteine protease